MATKLFLRNTTNNGIVDAAIASIIYDMEITAGAASDTAVVNTTASGTEIQFTKTAGGSTVAWISGRVPAGGFTLTTTDIDAWLQESNMNANIGGRYRVFKYSGGSLTELGGGPFNDGVELGTSAASMTWVGNVTDTSFAENDRIVIKLYITNVGTMGGGFTGTLTFNAADASTGDSFFNIAETVTFKAEDIVLSAGDQTINVSAPAQTELHEITLAAGANTINVSAPDATGVFGAGGTTLSAGGNTINISAPTATIHTFTSAVLVDDFNRADEQPVTNWTDYRSTSFQSAIVSNRFKWTGGNGSGMQSYFVPAKYTTPIDLTVDFPAIGSGFFGIQIVQDPLPVSGHDAYSLGYITSSNEWILEKWNDNLGLNYAVLFQATGSSGNFAAGDSMGLRLTAGGDISIFHKKSGQSNWTLITTVNDTLLSGSFYISLLSSSATTQFDNVMASSSNITLENVGTANIQVSAPEETLLAEITLAAGGNTINVSAPDIPAVHLTIPAGDQTINVSAPAQSQLVEITLAAGQQTVNISAPDATGIFDTPGANLAAGGNTINVSAPEETLLAEITLAAGANTINVSAPAPTVHLLIPAGLVQISISAPDATLVEEGVTNLSAGGNTINVSAPAVTVHLTTLAGLQQINISAPTGTVLAEISLTAGGTEIQVSAPSTTIHLSILAGGNTVEITAPLAIIPPTLLAGANTIFISAPDATIGNALDNVLEAGTPIVRIIVPIHTFKQTFPGAMRWMEHDASMELVTFDVAELARETNHEARSARNVEDSQVVITT